MPSTAGVSDDRPPGRAERLLRLAKLLLTVVLLAIAVWRAVIGAV